MVGIRSICKTDEYNNMETPNITFLLFKLHIWATLAIANNVYKSLLVFC